jgi:predicted transposase YdaD
MRLGPEGPRTLLEVGERNMAAENAAATLAGITEGRIAACLLPWIPLMQGGGETAIIERWKELASAEPDSRRRAEYGALALVFAEAARRREAWKQGLEKWNMIESQQVLEWMAEGEAKGRVEGKAEGKAEGLREGQLQASRTVLRGLLEDRFGPLPEALAQRIDAMNDMEALLHAARQVPRLNTLDDLTL